MGGFEQFLIDNGYHVYHFDCKLKQYVPGYKNLSTMVNLDNRYTKQAIIDGKHPTDVIRYGLEEWGFPPRIIHKSLPDDHLEVRKMVETMSFKEILDIIEKY